MSELMAPALAGAAAGLGVAVPVGAMGVLLVQEGMRDRRDAVAAASAVAVVDLAYAAVATALGPLVAAALSGVEAWVRLVSAGVLMVIAVRGLWGARRSVEAAPPRPGGAGGGAARTFARFAALTLVNPTTALYFAALTTAQGAALDGPGAGGLFVAGVFVASLCWQQLLVAAAGFAGARISPGVRAWTFRVGFGLVALYAVKVAVPLP
ncbi:LysE family transporter [Streptomyces sp. NBC_00237]|uniref:LysE family transporter n=1 Tax=Streptomyces sp. NBC_00237 TaxID=2975687 RepID=UPI00224DB090|nr:LysE family transporter [Streptomyces sp. NBC_00237]MCX5201384.1 LysE family transporter [Streptomyces sp. NBC_00237]